MQAGKSDVAKTALDLSWRAWQHLLKLSASTEGLPYEESLKILLLRTEIAISEQKLDALSQLLEEMQQLVRSSRRLALVSFRGDSSELGFDSVLCVSLLSFICCADLCEAEEDHILCLRDHQSPKVKCSQATHAFSFTHSVRPSLSSLFLLSFATTNSTQERELAAELYNLAINSSEGKQWESAIDIVR